jgi:ssDNA thymidine ADP-ribosyltransferase, DarT
MLSKVLTPERALIWRIVHRKNVPWILKNGLHAQTSGVRDPNYVQIGHAELIAKRRPREVPVAPFGTLADYIPFYFTPSSPMLLNILSGHGVGRVAKSDIVICVASLHRLQSLDIPFVFTDRHAYGPLANFYRDMSDLDAVNWNQLQARDFARDENDPAKFDCYQAEALVYKHLPIAALDGIVCYDSASHEFVAAAADAETLDFQIAVRPQYFFE